MNYFERARKFRAKKKLGQNFLIDESCIETILDTADIKKDDIVVEIGAGLGFVTEQLVKLAKKVYAVELDVDMVNELSNIEADNLEIIQLPDLIFQSESVCNHKAVHKPTIVDQFCHGIGTNFADNIASFAIHFKLFTICVFHNFDASTAVQTRNHVIAIQITDTINFQIHTENPSILSFITQPKISVIPSPFIVSQLRVDIFLTNTVDMLTAKHTIAGEKIIGSNVSSFRYSKTQLFIKSLLSNSYAFNNIITGDKAIASHNTQILIF